MVNIEIVKQIVTIQWRSVFPSSTPPPTILIYKLETFVTVYSVFRISVITTDESLLYACAVKIFGLSVSSFWSVLGHWLFRTLFLLNPKKTRIEFSFFLHVLISGVLFNYCILYTSWLP